MSRNPICITLWLLVSLIFLATAAAQQDITPPELVSFSFAPSSIDVTGGPASVVVTVHATDDLSGVQHIGAVFFAPSGFATYVNMFDWDRISGTANDGVYQTTATIPQYSEPGTWIVNEVSLQDMVSNHVSHFTGELTTMSFPTQLIVAPAAAVVFVDIKPGVFPNSINPKSKGVIPVAILTTPTFNATTVDPLSVRFGPNSAIESHRQGHIEDVDRDGDLDMVLHFKTEETGIACDATQAALTGQTTGGQAISGTDAIVTVGCGPGKLAADGEPPSTFGLDQNYPNPFNPTTTINYQLATNSHVTLKVFDILGCVVATLADEVQEAGYRSVQWDASGIASGVYVYRLQAAAFVEAKKLVVLR